MREWRNWQTRTFEGRVVHTVRVQVPILAPKIATHSGCYFFALYSIASREGVTEDAQLGGGEGEYDKKGGDY